MCVHLSYHTQHISMHSLCGVCGLLATTVSAAVTIKTPEDILSLRVVTFVLK